MGGCGREGGFEKPGPHPQDAPGRERSAKIFQMFRFCPNKQFSFSGFPEMKNSIIVNLRILLFFYCSDTLILPQF